MLGWVMIIAAVVLMYRVAEFENRSGIIWGAVTFGLCMGAAMTIPLPFVNIVVGVVVAFVAMFVAKAIQE